MEFQLASTLVVSQQISERMNSQKSEYHTEMANAVQVLSPLQQKRVEDTLNEIYEEMDEKERMERLRKWDSVDTRIVKMSYNFKTEWKELYFNTLDIASQALMQWLPPGLVRLGVVLGQDEIQYGLDDNLQIVETMQWHTETTGIPYNEIRSAILLRPVSQYREYKHRTAIGLMINGDTYASTVDPDFDFSFVEKYPHQLTPDEIVKVFGPQVPVSLIPAALRKFGADFLSIVFDKDKYIMFRTWNSVSKVPWEK